MGKEGRKRESFLNARWKSSWHLSHYCRDGFSCIAPTHMHVQSHKQAHTCRATSCHSTPPAQHLVIKARPRRTLIFRGERMNYSTRRRSGRALMSCDFPLCSSLLYADVGSFSVLITIFLESAFLSSSAILHLCLPPRCVSVRVWADVDPCCALAIKASGACRSLR